jgi:hypothetical protein
VPGFRLVSGTGPKETSCQDSPPPHVGSWDPSTKKGSRAAAAAAAAEALQQALLTGYGGAALLAGGGEAAALPGADYPARLAGLLLGAAKRLGVPLGAALEVGAGVGATSFQLAAGGFRSVLGVEHDARAVAAATAAQQTGVIRVDRKVRAPACPTGSSHACHPALPGPGGFVPASSRPSLWPPLLRLPLPVFIRGGLPSRRARWHAEHTTRLIPRPTPCLLPPPLAGRGPLAQPAGAGGAGGRSRPRRRLLPPHGPLLPVP